MWYTAQQHIQFTLRRSSGSPYEFAVLPADILGSIYERFLGRVIRLTAGHRAKVEEKPEVRKAGGVYYTPQYIVGYIVENAVGRQLEGKTPANQKKFRILDPACGFGSFLINAYQFLLNWYVRQYTQNPPQYKKQLVKVGDGGTAADYKLTIPERKRILTGHIYGVDIDSQAVEVIKLSLLLKALEGLNSQEIRKELFNERVLPNLSNNIKCGNSLIGSDFYGQSTLGLTDNEQYKINAFDREREFSDVFRNAERNLTTNGTDNTGKERELTAEGAEKNTDLKTLHTSAIDSPSGGFGAVVGNPPYGAGLLDREKRVFEEEIQFINSNPADKAAHDNLVSLIEQVLS